MINRLKQICTLILFCSISYFAFAGTDPVVVTKMQGKNSSNQNEIQLNAYVETIDPVYYSSNISYIENTANDKYLNTIALLINEDDRKYIAADFRVTITLDIEWTDMQGNLRGPLQKILEVDYKVAEGTKYDARNYFYFDNSRKVKITVTAIDIHGASWNPTEVLVIENRMEVKRDYTFNTTGTVANLGATPGTAENNKVDELVVSWDPESFKGITHYDIEWSWIDIDALDRYKISNQFDATLIFKNNSSRVTIPANEPSYIIPMIYDGSGYLFYRVRPLQYREDGDIKEGEWTAVGSNGISYYSYSGGHEPDLNWQVSTTYAEDGKRKTVISYFDGTLRSRQTVTKNIVNNNTINANNNTVVAETFYDYQGRPAVNILPAPTLNTVIAYASNFNRFATSGNPKDLYDLVPSGQTICSVNTPVLDNSYGASKYYSPNNPKVNDGFNKYIPDAQGYPYSETRYTPDATGRIASQGGVGPDYQLGANKHATNYYYGQADQHELDALFGTEVGDQSHYFKNMVRDANGQYSVSYTDMHGRTIATALAGAVPENMQAMGSYQSQTLTRNLLGKGNNIVKDRNIESSTTLLVPMAGSHTFHYELNPQSAEIIACNPQGQTVCYDCYYDLEIRITGTCGQTPIVITRRNFTFGTYDVNCGTPSPSLTVDETYTLEEGEYNITKKLTLSKDAQDWYRENLYTQKNICKTLLEFYNEIYQGMYSASNCNMTCTSCNEQLGSYNNYRARFLQSQGIDPNTPASQIPYENDILRSYTEAKAACDALCIDPENKISLLRDQLLQDMTPGQGQYAKQDVDLDNNGVSGEAGVVVYAPEDVNHDFPEWEQNTTRKYNIFNLSPPFTNYRPAYNAAQNCNPYYPFYTHPKEETSSTTYLYYRNDNGQRDESINPSGNICPPVSPITPDNFSNQFKETWANALVYYHPEYCKLKTIETTPALVNSYAWDSKLEQVDSWQAALTAETSGYILGNTGSVSAIINKDPFFSMAGASGYKATMLGYVNNSFRNGHSMWKYAMACVKCNNTNDPSCLTSIASYPTSATYSSGLNPCSADLNTTWRIFRSIYLTIKDSLVNVYLDQQCPGIDYNELTGTLKYKRRFGNYAEYYSNSIQTLVTNITGGADPEPQLSTQLTEIYTSTCDSYIQMWKNKLLECDQISSLAAGTQDEILNSITQQMKTICIQGSDPDHPFGSSTIKPGDPYTPQTFEQVIASVFTQYGITTSAVCNKYVIDYPQPYTMQLSASNSQVSSTKDSCMCARLAQLEAERQSDGFYGNLSQFIEYKHGVFIRNTLLRDTLLPGCTAASVACATYDPPIDIPGILDCNSIYKTCVSCSDYTNLKSQFAQEFPSFSVIYPNPANDDELNRNIAFERFMNRKTSFRKTWMDYLLFEQACQNYNQTWSCTTLDSMIHVFQLANAAGYWGHDCEQAFTNFFNQTYGSYYTYSGITALYIQYCGNTPDLCRPVINCQTFKDRIADFYQQYGNSIAGSPTCQQQFTNYFNDYYNTDYTTTEIWSLFSQLCGYDLDVCTPLNCDLLREILENWHETHPDTWLMDGTACTAQWVTYFNNYANTNLADWQISELYANCGVSLNPCSPQIDCETLAQYKSNYENMGASACEEAELDRESPTYCQECFTYYINQQLESNYTYTELKQLYQIVCNDDPKVCEGEFSCESLSEVARDFSAQAPPNAMTCEEAFADYFNNKFGTSFNYSQIMGIYSAHCGLEPAICDNYAVLNCDQLTYVLDRFKSLYPNPASYFGSNCEGIFTDYFKLAFGGSHSWNDIVSYYLNLCGQTLNVCDSNCVQLQTILTNYNLEYGSYALPQQLCRDLFTKWVNDQLGTIVPLTWFEVDSIYIDCDINLNICPSGTQLLSCDKLEGARQAFYAFYPTLPQNCEAVFTSFFNLYFQTDFGDMTELQDWVDYNCQTEYNVCSGNIDTLQITLRTESSPQPTLLPPMLCDAGPLFPVLTDTSSVCENVKMLAWNSAVEQYNIYVRNKKNEFDKKYKEKCLAAAPLEVFTVSSAVAEYHYTLYYYDQAGSLVKTVPPAGVNPNFTSTFYNQVETARQNVYNGQSLASNIVVPTHALTTEYRYNTLGQVIQQKSPDGGLSKFWYDQLGRLVVSQNAKQTTGNKYSYTKYDVLGRITEVGQLTSSTAITQATSQSESALGTWFSNAGSTRQQITITKYDLAQDNPDLCTPPTILCQKNLRNRVSYTYVQPTASFSNNNLSYSTATYYTYDIHGNVDILLQHYNDGVMQTVTGNAFKRIEYKYDLVSGKVNEVAYQPGYKDQFYHRYSYNAENKLTKTETSPDYIYWQQQSSYSYYRHGPLARSEIGQLAIQGVDYVYTLQGWLKGVNSSSMISYDAGGDGANGIRPARDAYGFSLNYNTTDYTPINSSVTPFSALSNGLPQLNADGVNTGKNLFNGNIRAMLVNIPKLGDTKLYGYRYDQLNRITAMNTYSGLNTDNTFTAAVTFDYKERITYDPNGNILTYLRNGTTANSNQQTMDNLTYNYITNSNKLGSVDDAVASGNYAIDIDDQSANNYEYDEIGNLTKDVTEGITSIEWTVYGKISKITKSNGDIVEYVYDASGNRISKKNTPNGGTVRTTFYVRDASGNVMAIYEKGNSSINSGKLSQIEVDLNGSSRLGVWNRNLDVESTNWWVFETTAMTGTSGGRTAVLTRGNIAFELSNHLGNVLVTASDRKVQVQDPNNTTQTLYYAADIITATDYYPFGMVMPERKFGNDNRYGFNGKERDKEMYSLTAYDYGFRIYNPAIGKFLSIDPLTASYPELTPYQYSSNNPVLYIDIDGLEGTVNDLIKDRPTIDMTQASSGSPTNAQGIPRNGRYFWGQMLQKHPEFFDIENISLIKSKRAPIVNETWIKHFPMDAEYSGNILIHHHYNGGTMAMGIPEKMHLDNFSNLHQYVKRLRGQSFSSVSGGLMLALDAGTLVTGALSGNPDNWINAFPDYQAPEKQVGEITRTRSIADNSLDAYFTIDKVETTTTTVTGTISKKVYAKWVSERTIYATIYSDYIWDNDKKKYIGVNKVYTQTETLEYNKKGRITGGWIERSDMPGHYQLGKDGKVLSYSSMPAFL